MYRIAFSIALVVPLVASCTESVVEDEFLADDIVQTLDDTKADQGSNATYYHVSPDLRRCQAPMCGGVFYKLANSNTTRCSDGRHAASCYAASVDWVRLGLHQDGIETATDSLYAGDLIVRATVGRKSWNPGVSFAELRPTEAWDGQGPNQPSGVFTKVASTGVRCITTPCPLFLEGKLNSQQTKELAELGWDESDATQEQIDLANENLIANQLIIAGSRYTVTGPGGRMAARTVTNFYQRVTDAPDQAGIPVHSRDWSAWRGAFLPCRPEGPCPMPPLFVKGTVDLPSPGYSASLEVAAPQGINTAELILDLRLRRRDGVFPQVVTPVTVEFSKSPGTSYTSVLIRESDGDTVRINVTR